MSKPTPNTETSEMVGLDFLTELRAANSARNEEYRAKTAGEPLPILFRTTEFAGEVGELLNVIKKMERERLGWGGKRASREAMLEEFGGVMATLDLLAMDLGVDLAEATRAEFNKVTDRLGLNTHIPTLDAAEQRGSSDSTVDELSMLVRQLARMLPEGLPHKVRALDYLKRKNLMGSPLRALQNGGGDGVR